MFFLKRKQMRNLSIVPDTDTFKDASGQVYSLDDVVTARRGTEAIGQGSANQQRGPIVSTPVNNPNLIARLSATIRRTPKI